MSRTTLRYTAAFLVVLAFDVTSLHAQLLPPVARAPVVQAQGMPGDTLVFERVADRPADAHDLAFDTEGALWAIDAGLWRLPPGGRAWEEVALTLSSSVLPLGPDTLLGGGTSTRRSVDGGQTWTRVHEDGWLALFAARSGTIVTGSSVGSGVAYSHDRGATWTPGSLDAGFGLAVDFAELPEGHAHAGRLVAACWVGLSYSDDDGVTWRASSLWDPSRYLVPSVTVGVDGRVYAVFGEVGVAGTQVAVSADGGETYGIVYGFGVPRGSTVRVVALPGGTDPAVGVLLVVEFDGSVWRSDDGAESFRRVGVVPFLEPYPTGSSLEDALLGPDGRLYVAGSRSGSEAEWVYRTVEPVVTAAAPRPEEPEERALSLEVAPNPSRGGATVVLTLAAPSAVEVSVYDGLGRAVAVLHRGPLAAGVHTLAFEGSDLPAGRYVVRAEAGKAVATTTLALMR